MDFVESLPKTKKNHDAIWVIVDRLTKSTHFLPHHTNQFVEDLAKQYISKIMRLHRIPISINSEWDARFVGS